MFFSRPINYCTGFANSDETINIGFIIYQEDNSEISEIKVYLIDNFEILEKVKGFDKSTFVKFPKEVFLKLLKLKFKRKKHYPIIELIGNYSTKKIYLSNPMATNKDISESIEICKKRYLSILNLIQEIKLEEIIIKLEQ